jgi:hypothetical protein
VLHPTLVFLAKEGVQNTSLPLTEKLVLELAVRVVILELGEGFPSGASSRLRPTHWTRRFQKSSWSSSDHLGRIW